MRFGGNVDGWNVIVLAQSAGLGHEGEVEGRSCGHELYQDPMISVLEMQDFGSHLEIVFLRRALY